MTNSIVLPTTADEMRDAIKIAIETYHKSPANDKNKLKTILVDSGKASTN